MRHKSRSKSSKRWLQEHFNDGYVKQAQQQGWRSRAVFKLKEIQDKDHLIKPGMTVVDLGAAPGSWSQIAAQWVGDKGLVVAIDLLAMDPLPGVSFIQDDFLANSALQQLQDCIGDKSVDIVMSDMAPNISGVAIADQAKSMGLVEAALDFALQTLNPKGAFICKVFQGEGFDEFLKQVRSDFSKVLIRKPKASRDRSREVYIIGIGLK